MIIPLLLKFKDNSFSFQWPLIYRDDENDIDNEDVGRPTQPEHREQNEQRQRVTQLNEVAAKVVPCITTTTVLARQRVIEDHDVSFLVVVRWSSPLRG
jgi:hypothetical protein